LIVGCGSIGKRHARVLAGLGVADLRACDLVSEQRASLSSEVPTVRMYGSYTESLRDHPEVVLICTPPKLHIPMAVEAVKAGAHVLCEKPLSDATDGIDELAALAAESGKKVMVALCFRYHEGLFKVKRCLDSGRVGRLVSIRAMMGEHLPSVRPDYRNLFTSRYSGAFDLTHEVDLAIWFAGQTVREVHCVSGSYSDLAIEAPDLVEMLIGFENRCVASVHLDFFQRPRRRQIELIGTDGVAIVEFARWDRCTVSVYEAASGSWQQEELVTNRDDMFRAEDREFLEAVAEDKPITCTIAEARKSVETIVAARRIVFT